MVELKALMARIDVNIRLASETTDNDLPGLMMESWTAVNVPTEVCFKAPENGKTTPALENHKLSEKKRLFRYHKPFTTTMEVSAFPIICSKTCSRKFLIIPIRRE